MPDLPTRKQHEEEIAALLILLFGDYQDNPATFDLPTFEQELQATLSGKLAAVYREAGSGFVSGLGAAVGPEVVEANALKWEIAFLPVLAAALGKTTDPLHLGSFSLDRAEMVAATEVTRAITSAEMGVAGFLTATDGWGPAGPKRPIWYTTSDERVCPICEPLHRVGQEAWEKVAISGPPAHPRCRCWLTWS